MAAARRLQRLAGARRLQKVGGHLLPPREGPVSGPHGSAAAQAAAAAAGSQIIVSVRAARPIAPDGTPSSDWGGIQGLGQICVAVETADGSVGYGIGGGGQPGIGIIEQALRPLMIGQDASDVEGLWEAMYTHTLAYGRKGLAIMAISGVDLALWDLRGKAADGGGGAAAAADRARDTRPGGCGRGRGGRWRRGWRRGGGGDGDRSDGAAPGAAGGGRGCASGAD